MKFKTQFNAHEFPSDAELNTKPSLTVPDQSMTIAEIMRRFAQGLPMEGQKVPVYNGDTEVPDFRKMDLVDIQELRERNEENIKNIQTELQSKKPPKKIDEAQVLE